MEGEHPANRYPLGVTFCRVATAQQAEAAECTSATPSKAVVTGYAAAYGRQHARRFQGRERWYDLIVILDDATSEIYYARLVEEEGTRTVLAALREVIETRGVFCALYSDRGEPFFVNPKAREPVDKARLTQVGRALRELGIQMIPAYSPQARGRMERSYRTWQGRLPQELRIRGLRRRKQPTPFCARSTSASSTGVLR